MLKILKYNKTTYDQLINKKRRNEYIYNDQKSQMIA